MTLGGKLRWFVAVALASALAAACDRPPPPDGAKAWTPSDHDRAEEQQSGQQAAAAQPPRRGGGDGGASQTAELADATWASACASCHGPSGHGDGPQGPMVNARDLASDEWQTKVTDAELAASITSGKGRMPKFDLSPPLVSALVAKVRSLRGR